MNSVERCFSQSIVDLGLINRAIRYASKNIKNKQQIYGYITSSGIDLRARLCRILDSEILLKFLILLRVILPDIEFSTLCGCKLPVARNTRAFYLDVVVSLSNMLWVFGHRLDSYKITADGKCEQNRCKNTIFVFFNQSNAKIYDNQRIIIVDYGMIEQYKIFSEVIVFFTKNGR